MTAIGNTEVNRKQGEIVKINLLPTVVKDNFGMRTRIFNSLIVGKTEEVA